MTGYAFSMRAVEAAGVEVTTEYSEWRWAINWRKLRIRQGRYAFILYDGEFIGSARWLWKDY